MSEIATIDDAILAVMEEVPYVQKRHSDGLNYSFVGEVDLLQALRASMLKNRLYVVPVSAELANRSTYNTTKGTAMASSVVRMAWELHHEPSKTSRRYESLGEGSDSSDKGVGKACTSALKYFLRQGFMIETGDDPDEVREERGADNERAFDIAWNAIGEAASTQQVEKLQSRIPVSPAQFTSDQQRKLEKRCADKLAQLQLK